jgi:hypothetical protein
MSLPEKKRERGIPVGLLLIILSVFGAVGLVALGAKNLVGTVKLVNFPIAGEWEAKGRPWRMEFRPDKTVVSSTAPSPSAAPQTWASEPGTYKIDYFGNLWVMLKNGKTYTAALAPLPDSMAPSPQNRFDLVESGTESVTVFEKVPSANPPPPASKGPAQTHP